MDLNRTFRNGETGNVVVKFETSSENEILLVSFLIDVEPNFAEGLEPDLIERIM